jgi:aldehyde:ferredoxin oxidoreductase
MLGGFMGKFLWVDLSTSMITKEIPEENLFKDFIGGYGIGAKILYDRMPPGVDPLGPDNILGFITGPLTGTTAPTGTRWTVVGKSPLTDGWGDSSCSGYFGPKLKHAGYDAVFFSGISEKPVYLFIDDDEVDLRSAEHLWGMDTYEVDDWTKENLGKDFEAACIGQAGEMQTLIAGIINAKGRAAGRSGLGAVMGSKRLKMVVARGTQTVPVADPQLEKIVKKQYRKDINDGVGGATLYRNTGTPGVLTWCIKNADAPIKNWAGTPKEFPDTDPLEFDELKKVRVKRQACWRCPIACWGTSKVEYDGDTFESHQPEYETSAAFGSMTLVNNYPAIIRTNDICNRYGLDTMSAGACVAFAIECYVMGLIGLEETGGLDLCWMDDKSVVAMLEKLAKREDFGDVLALGVKRAAEVVGPKSNPYAIHVGGQELAMHDPRYEPGLGLIYVADATPGRHTQGAQFTVAPGFETDRPGYGENRDNHDDRGKWGKEAMCLCHTMNASGVCLFGYASTNVTFVPDYIKAVTGQNFSVDDMLLCGERIANIRQAFNVREGINMLKFELPGRAYGRPPQTDGPTAGITVQIEKMMHDHLENMGWTQDAAIPKPEVLERLGLGYITPDLWHNHSAGEN